MPVVKKVTVNQDVAKYKVCSKCKKALPIGTQAVKDTSHKVTIIREKGKKNQHKRQSELPTLYRHLECQRS